MKQNRTNLAVFIPHYGCKHQCSFCDQRVISGQREGITKEQLERIFDERIPYLAEGGFTAEIAFFGGTFTAIPTDYLISLLQTAKRYVDRYPDIFVGMRCSTRPDCIDDEMLSLLRHYGMTSIELGAQSMDDDVLRQNQRGHTAEDVRAAARLIRKHGFSLGLQMMTGLYGDSEEKCRYTADQFVQLEPDCVRIYPTVIMPNTMLGELYLSGEYKTFSLDETVTLCADLYKIFVDNGISVLRIGLNTSEEIERQMLGGCYHPALGEMVIGRYYYNIILAEMKKLGGTHFIIECDKRQISKIAGHKGENRRKLEQLGLHYKLKISDGEKLCFSKPLKSKASNPFLIKPYCISTRK